MNEERQNIKTVTQYFDCKPNPKKRHAVFNAQYNELRPTYDPDYMVKYTVYGGPTAYGGYYLTTEMWTRGRYSEYAA